MIDNKAVLDYYRNMSEGMDGSENEKEPRDKIDWHLAFFQALQLEFESNWDDLKYIYEHHLSREPLRIDVIIVKKENDVVIENPIGRIFRKYNMVEFKSHEDNISVADFYKVLGYMYIYKSTMPKEVKETGLEDITITFIEMRYPKDLFKHLEERGFKIRERESGIYNIEGYFVPIQVIETKALSKENSKYLWTLRTDLNVEELKYVMWNVREDHKLNSVGYVQAVLRGNPQTLEEVMRMGAITFEEVLDKYGYVNKNELEAKFQAERNKLQEESTKWQAEVEQLRLQVSEVTLLRTQVAELQAKLASIS